MSNNLCRRARRSRPSNAKIARVVANRPTPVSNLTPGVIPVSVTMIVKDCAETLEKTLQSLEQGFLLPGDEVLLIDTGSQDGGLTARTALKFGARLVSRPDLRCNLRPFIKDWIPELERRYEQTDLVQGCILDFAQARQIAMVEAKHDIQFWIDSDDILEEVEPYRLRKTIDRFYGGERKIDAIFMDYIYWTDESDGSITSILKRERVIDRAKYRWVGRCHETAIEQQGVQVRPAYFHDLGARIKHLRTPPDEKNVSPADIRNYIVIRREIEENKAAGKVPDPRSIFYLANAARGVRHAAEAIQLYKEFIPTSGSKEDRWAAAYYIATIYLDARVGRPYDALEWLQMCSRFKPEDPRSYFGLQRAYHQLQQYDASNFWYDVGRKLPEPKQTLHNYDPRHINALPFQVRALTAIKQENKTGLTDAMNLLMANSPEHIDTKQLSEYAGNWLAGEELTLSTQRLLANTGATGEAAISVGRELTSRLRDIPDKLEDLFLALKEPTAFLPERKQLDIFCGKAVEAWGPLSGIRGIGGSEKAVIQMAPRLQARGYQVNVYANVPREQRGIDVVTGVNWQHFGAYDFERERDTVIYWRGPGLLENKMNYRRRILWCHDVQNPQQWTPARVALADQVWVLTDFHATTLGSVREQLGDKLKITRNGIDSARLREVLKVAAGKRDPFKIVYSSSPDRGVLTAMKIFETAKKLENRLRLHVFYGFNKLFVENMARYEYASVPDAGRDVHLGEYWSECLQMADRLDIPWHGRVGWDQLAAEMATAGVWLYPTRFPEISCMSAFEAMALGCVPVHSNKYALAESTEGRGLIIDPDNIEEAARALVKAANEPFDREMQSEWALGKYDYERLADEWMALLAD